MNRILLPAESLPSVRSFALCDKKTSPHWTRGRQGTPKEGLSPSAKAESVNINAGIIDQHVRGLGNKAQPQIEAWLDKTLSETMLRSVAFVVLAVKTLLDLTLEESIETLCEGGNDFGVDAIHIGDLQDAEFTVTLVQGKYYHENLEGNRGFPQGGVEKAIQAVRALFNPSAELHLNPKLRPRVEEVRSLIMDGNIPRVRYLLCNNGATWKHPESQTLIEQANFGNQVTFEHVNHDTLVRIMQSIAPVKDTLQFSGKAIVEDLNYSRVLVGKVAVTELARLMDNHGDRLLERNIRRYLGLQGNRVNQGIQQTLTEESERSNFYFYNNGVTFICTRFEHNALQPENHLVRVEGLQIINGGQTSKTIQTTLRRLQSAGAGLEQAFVLVRLYQLPSESAGMVQTITYATNSQNPVDLKDLRSNDPLQKVLELSMKELGYGYRRQRSDSLMAVKDITVGTAAEAVLSTWRGKPQQAKFRSSEHFGKLYEEIFTQDLNAAQVVIAVLLFRIAENRRKRPPAGSPELVRYASCFSAMLMGQQLLQEMNIALPSLNHRNFKVAKKLVEEKGETYFEQSVALLREALDQLYGHQQVSPLRLSATFRRGDLLEYLPRGPAR